MLKLRARQKKWSGRTVDYGLGNCEETFQFSAGQRTVRVSVMSS